MREPIKLLLIFVNESDRLDGARLYQSVVQRLRLLGVAGATAHAGILGYGHHRRLHDKGLFGVADDRPVTIMAVDEESRIRAALPEIRGMVGEGLILLHDVELIADQDPGAHGPGGPGVESP